MISCGMKPILMVRLFKALEQQPLAVKNDFLIFIRKRIDDCLIITALTLVIQDGIEIQLGISKVIPEIDSQLAIRAITQKTDPPKSFVILLKIL